MYSPEQELLNRLIKGDVDAFEEVFKENNRKVFAFSFRYLKNREEAEGIVQEVFLKLWEKSSSLKKDSNIDAWIFTVTFNAIRKRFRKLSAEKKHVESYSNDIESEKEQILDSEYFDLLEKSDHLIEQLPPQQKKILLLRKEEGFTSNEIAEKMNLSKKTVDNHLHRARTFLKQIMIEQGLL